MEIRNICIIAHVDHGKTTLVDHLLRQAGTFQAHQAISERMMDSGDLERERGITILAKNASIIAKDVKINLVDTPGHADFGGEVERILGMVDGALLLVDAAEGPLPQTRFVLQKALANGHKVILVINKVDRPECKDGSRIREVVNQTFDLFVDLGANEEQADFAIVYACAREGWCTLEFDDIPELVAGTKRASLEPLFDLIINKVPKPKISDEKGFQLLVSNLAYSNYVGRLAIGRVLSGSVKRDQPVCQHGVDANGKPKMENFNVSRLYLFKGMEQVETDEILAGDIGAVAGSEKVEIGDSFTSDDKMPPLPRIQVEKPTIGMVFSTNASPYSGKEGKAIQSRQLRDRLLNEVRNNVALQFEETATPDQFRLLGRGELQFAILIEQMRRENLEFMVGTPSVLYKTDETGQRLEPFEHAVLDLPQDYAGEVTQIFQGRKGILTRYEPHSASGSNRVRLEFDIPTRGLLGIRSRYLTATRGEGLLSSHVLKYAPHKGDLPRRSGGAIISDRTGPTTEYALLSLEERGELFCGPGVAVYEGMIIGEHSRVNDLNVNCCREKKLTNIRAAHAEVLVTLKGIRQMSLERCLEWIDEDEWIEVTPKSIRMRKKILAGNLRSVRREDRID